MRKNKERFLKYSVILSLLTTALWLLSTGAWTRAVVYFLQNMEDTVLVDNFTSTEYRYNDKFQQTLNRYKNFQSMYQEEYSTAIPGLSATDVMGNICNQMVPQGICIAGDYMLITAYDNSNKFHKLSNSVIYVLSNTNPQRRQLLTTIILPDVNHVGGIAYDGERIWIAKSTTRKCSIIDYKVIKEAAESEKGNYFLEDYTQNVDCGGVASFVTYYNNRIWVGTYANRISGTGTLRSYDVIKGKKIKLLQREEIIIPEFANGITFMEDNGKTYMAISTSQGRYFHSKIYFYQVEKDIFSEKNLYYCYDSSEFPPMAEELICDGENTYLLFESSATCYSTPTYAKCSYPVDRICALSTIKLFRDSKNHAYDNVGNKLKYTPIQAMEYLYYQSRREYWRICA